MATLFNFQKEGVRFIEAHGGKALIADEMGLGKTVQALSWLYRNPQVHPALIVCPSSLKINWRRETKRWVKCPVQIVKGKKVKSIKPYPVTIINYDILQYWLEYLQQLPFKSIVIDEAHYIKNSKAIRTKSVKRLCKRIYNIVALTGTPIESRPIEMYNIIQLINPMLFPNFWHYAERYCNAKRGRFGWELDGASNTHELYRILTGSIMIRRKKIDVLKELPKKLISIVPMAIDNRAEYTEAEDNFIEYVEKKIDSDLKKLSAHIATEVEKFNKVHDTDYGFAVSQDNENEYKKQRIESISKAPVLVQIEYLKQLAVKGKMKQIMEWIDNFIESGEKLVIFATHRNIIDTLYAKYQSIAVKLYGGMTPTKRQKAVDDFQKDEKVKLFIGNIDSAGVGITLTAASNVAMIELPWNPGDLIQASDRVHRITQTKQVTIYNLVAVNTIEERLIELLHEKQEIIEQVLDGKLKHQTNILADLINSYKTI